MRFLDSVLNRKVGLIERRQKEQTLRELGEELVNLEYEEMYAISINNEGRKNTASRLSFMVFELLLLLKSFCSPFSIALDFSTQPS